MIEDVLDRIADVAKGYPKMLPNPLWGQVQIRFDLPRGSSEGDLEAAERETGLPLPAAYKTLLQRWDGPGLFERWPVDGSPGPLGGLLFLSTRTLRNLGYDSGRELDSERDAVLIASGEGCEILMDPDRDEVYVHEECVPRYFLLCRTLEEFLCMVLDAEGVPFWTDRTLWKPLEP